VRYDDEYDDDTPYSPPRTLALRAEKSDGGLRIGDAERDAAAKVLHKALAQGRLTAEEHEQRTGWLFDGTSKTAGDITRVLAGLVAAPEHRMSRLVRLARRLWPARSIPGIAGIITGACTAILSPIALVITAPVIPVLYCKGLPAAMGACSTTHRILGVARPLLMSGSIIGGILLIIGSIFWLFWISDQEKPSARR
jgi:hypothetical protein